MDKKFETLVQYITKKANDTEAHINRTVDIKYAGYTDTIKKLKLQLYTYKDILNVIDAINNGDEGVVYDEKKNCL